MAGQQPSDVVNLPFKTRKELDSLGYNQLMNYCKLLNIDTPRFKTKNGLINLIIAASNSNDENKEMDEENQNLLQQLSRQPSQLKKYLNTTSTTDKTTTGKLQHEITRENPNHSITTTLTFDKLISMDVQQLQEHAQSLTINIAPKLKKHKLALINAILTASGSNKNHKDKIENDHDWKESKDTLTDNQAKKTQERKENEKQMLRAPSMEHPDSVDSVDSVDNVDNVDNKDNIEVESTGEVKLNDEEEEEDTLMRLFNMLSNAQVNKENAEKEEKAVFESMSPKDQIGEKLIQLIETNEADTFFTLLQQHRNDEQVYQYLIHDYRSQDEKKSLLVAACEYNNDKIFDFLINVKGINVNCSDKYGRTPLYWSSANNNINMAIKVGENGGNPNVISSKNGNTPIMHTCQHGNVKMIQVLIKYGLDFVKYINYVVPSSGATPLAVAVQNGHLDYVKCLFDLEKEISSKNKIKEKIINLSQTVQKNNILHLACSENQCNVVKYLIQEQELLQVKIRKMVHVNVKNDDQLQDEEDVETFVSIINDTNHRGDTPFGTAASNGHKQMLTLLYQLCKERNINFDLNKCGSESGGLAPIHRAINDNHWQCVEWFVNNTQEDECDCNLKVDSGETLGSVTPLTLAILMGSDKSVEILCNSVERVNIVMDLMNNFRYAIIQSNVKILKTLLSTLINHPQIKFGIDESTINEMIKTADRDSSSQSLTTLAMTDFLHQFKDIVATQNHDLLELIFSHDSDSDNASKQQISVKLQQCQKVLSITSNLKQFCVSALVISGDDIKEFATKLVGVINEMINHQVMVNDTLLMLSREFDIQAFETSLKNSISKCISIDSKNKIHHAKDIVWYKNCILNSNVLCLPASPASCVPNSLKRKDSARVELLFDTIVRDVVEKELHKQQVFIRDEIKKMKELDSDSWDHLLNYQAFNIDIDNVISQQNVTRLIAPGKSENIMKNNGLQAKYSGKDLINDPITGFNGAAEYDNNGYLTDLIIAANKLNPQFQQDCRRLLNSKMLGVECVFSEAPIKAKERCKIKAAVDYSDREWPHTCNILDIIRCSVSFKTPKDLLSGLDKFRAMVGAIERAYVRVDKGCLGGIVRLKNMFASIKNWDDKDLTKYSYCDVKCNVFVDNGQFSMIAEVQFMLDFMVSAKKLGHIFYSIVRNDDLYREIWGNMASSSNYDDVKQASNNGDDAKANTSQKEHREKKIREIKSIIVRKDYHALSHLVFYGNFENIITKFSIDINELLESCQINKWMKGYRLIKCSLPNLVKKTANKPKGVRKQRALLGIKEIVDAYDNDNQESKKNSNDDIDDENNVDDDSDEASKERKEKKDSVDSNENKDSDENHDHKNNWNEKKVADKFEYDSESSDDIGKVVLIVNIEGGVLDFNSITQEEQGLVLFHLIQRNDFDQCKGIISIITKDQRKYLLSQWKTRGITIPLSCMIGDERLELLRFILDKYFDDIDINATAPNGANLLLCASETNLMDIIELIFEKSDQYEDIDIDVNCVSRNITIMWYACYHGNLRLMKLLIKHGFDFKNNINHKKTPEGFSTLHICCQTGNLECLEYLIFIDNTLFDGNAIDYYATTTQGLNALSVAANTGRPHIVEYLVKDIQYLERKEKESGKLLFDINNTDKMLTLKRHQLSHVNENDVNKFKGGINMVHVVAQGGFVSILKLLNKYSIKSGNPIDYTIKDKRYGCNVLSMACRSTNHTAGQCVQFLLDAAKNNNQDIGLNEQDTIDHQHLTPLMAACQNGNISAVKCLLQMNQIKILDILDDNGRNALDIAVVHGKTQILQLLLSKLIDKYNIKDLNHLNKLDIVNSSIVSKWIDMAQTHASLQYQAFGNIFALMQKLNMNVKNNDNDETIDFLNQLKLNVFTEDDNNSSNNNKFEWFKARLDFGLNSNAVLHENLGREYDEMKRTLYMIEMLEQFSGIGTSSKDNGVLVKLARIINHMIKEKQPVNDTLIMIAYKFDSINFAETLASTIKECIGVKPDLSRITENERDIAWFKECIAKSKVFALPAIASKSKNETLFDQVNRNIISNELLKQQKFIHSKVAEYKQDEDWVTLINCHNYTFGRGSLDETTIQQNLINSQYFDGNYMEKHGGIQPKYTLTSLTTNYSTGFNARNEYDYNGYLNDLQIVASNIDPIFQKECKLLFTNGKHIDNKTCVYTSAPMKTRQRCQMKASIDYSDKSWPNTSCLLDLIRCSVVFQTPKDLLNGLDKLKALIGFTEKEKGFGCLFKIVRIKNMFQNIKRWDNDIAKCGYCDVKLNVLIKVPNYKYSLIGEIQLMLNWMLEAKKIGHSFYSLQRNEELYHALATTLTNDKKLMQLDGVNIKSKNSQNEFKTEEEVGGSLSLVAVNEKMNQLKSIIARQDYHSLSKEVLVGTIDKLKTNKTVNFKDLMQLCLQAKWSKGFKLLKSVVES